MSDERKGKRVAILVTDGFEQIELTSPREALQDAGAKCVIVSNAQGQVPGDSRGGGAAARVAGDRPLGAFLPPATRAHFRCAKTPG